MDKTEFDTEVFKEMVKDKKYLQVDNLILIN